MIDIKRCYIVNLKRRPDRLSQIMTSISNIDWPFPKPIVFPAVDGSKCAIPTYFKGNPSVWGCIRSHIQLLETIMSDEVENAVIIEDDCFFVDGFYDKTLDFLDQVPDDWDQLMLGGQHMSYPLPITKTIIQCINTQRTHCYIIRNSTYMRNLYLAWLEHHNHCDWCMSSMHARYKVYAPTEFITGQDLSKSDIMSEEFDKRTWNKPPKDMKVVLLKCDRLVRDKLIDIFHFGYSIDIKTGIDNGLINIFDRYQNILFKVPQLKMWFDLVGGEAFTAKKILAVWHPKIMISDLKDIENPIVEITGYNREDILAQLG